MRKPHILLLTIAVWLIFSPGGLAAPEEVREYAFEHGMLRFDARHELIFYATDAGEIHLQGVLLDAGVDGNFLLNTIGHQRFWDMNTWDLARVVPRAGLPYEQEPVGVHMMQKGIRVVTAVEGMELSRTYTPTPQGLKVEGSLTSRRGYVSEVQGISLQVHGLAATEDTAFRFPGNTPYGVTRLSDLRHFATRQADYAAPLVRVDEGGQSRLNLVFLHTEEKWSTALWRDREMNLQAAFLAMTEGLLHRDESYAIGPLYLQITQGLADVYAPARELYELQGWRAPTDGAVASGPMYAAHPHGTMDAGFRDRNTMGQFAKVLPGLADMGIKSLWILPIFEHTGRGVYEPADQALIDPRYGSDDEVRAFAEQAQELDMKLLFDYVPHGPYPEDKLAVDNPQWCAVHRLGHPQIEWDCVSFDMANPDYQRYTRSLVSDHIQRFAVDGGRIDCAMGGLSNWQPVAGNRPSSSGLAGGVQIVGAIRQAFLDAGKAPLLLPENFHPLPMYAGVSDVYYDMPLYRALFDMRNQGLAEAALARELVRWLEDEYKAGVPGQQRLRFLGNHDTVSWTWDRARATAVWGVERAKALWTLFSFIDGVPFLYQGDEYAPIYDKRSGLDLRDFFAQLFAARAQHLNPGMDITYHHQNSALVAFTRTDGQQSRLALVNLGMEEARYILPEGVRLLYGEGSIQEGQAILGAYQSLLLDLP